MRAAQFEWFSIFYTTLNTKIKKKSRKVKEKLNKIL